MKARQFAGAYGELEKASGWNGRSWLCLLPSWPSKEISTSESIPRSGNVRGCCKIHLGSFITSGLWLVQALPCFGAGFVPAVPQRVGQACWACVRAERGAPCSDTVVAWGGSARASKGTSVCPVMDSPNPVSLVTLNKVMS